MKIDILNLKFIDSKIARLCVWLEEELGFEFTITSIYRDGDKGVHGTIPVRGIDLRLRNYNIATQVVNLINSHWLYDEKRPVMKCAMFHNVGSGHHIHLQVHPNTTFFSAPREG